MTSGKTIRLKVCGMRDPENIRTIALLQPDYMGFIFYPRSPRFVGDDFSIPLSFPAHIKKVGVFVNETTHTMLRQSDRLSLDYLQLHGNEPVEQVRTLKEQGIKIIKAFSVDEHFDFGLTLPYASLADFFLFDTKGKYYGGNAQIFDWGILKNYDQQVPFFLSGGLTPDNVEAVESLKGMNLHALDINSGVETQPAVKDEHRVYRVTKFLKNTNLKHEI